MTVGRREFVLRGFQYGVTTKVLRAHPSMAVDAAETAGLAEEYGFRLEVRLSEDCPTGTLYIVDLDGRWELCSRD